MNHPFQESERFVIEGQAIALADAADARAWVPILGGRVQAFGWHLQALAIIEAGSEGTRRHTLAPREAPARLRGGSPSSHGAGVLQSKLESVWPPADDPFCPLAIQRLTEAERQQLLAAVFGRPVMVGQRWRIPLRCALWQAGNAPNDQGPGIPAYWQFPDGDRLPAVDAPLRAIR